MVPAPFLVRLSIPCPYLPLSAFEGKSLALSDLPPLDSHAGLGETEPFAEIRMGWNEVGLGIQVAVSGRSRPPVGDRERPRSSDGLTFWLDTRADRTAHRASRFCHQFHLLASGGGDERDEPILVQSKINRALQDATFANPDDLIFKSQTTKTGYKLEAFFPASALNGYDPEQHPVLGFYTAVRDSELGDQFLMVNQDFPFSDDPSLWQALELVKAD